MAQMKWQDAIKKVLDAAEEPVQYTDIAQAIIDEGLRTNVGATPAATVAAQLSRPPLVNEVVRVERGTYALSTRHVAPLESESPLAVVEDIAPPAPSESTDVEDMGLINAFGMYWRRDGIDWSRSRNAQLFGSQQSGSAGVDFAPQAGIYLLHDRSRTIYVGRVTKERMGARLWEHTRDRLSGRWDRFSWFGVRPVREDGSLGTSPSGIDIDMLIATLEALIIEGLEPPQNRRQGDRFNALEFIQIIDPDLERRRLLSQVTTALSSNP